MQYRFRPLTHWHQPETKNRTPAYRFSAAWPDTLNLLGSETDKLGARLVVIEVDATEDEVRRDGMLRANARVGFPGVRISFESRHGPLAYATDVYDGWKANVRAIALGLQALRAVDRYGITRTGEQYRGFTALPSGANTKMTREEAAAFLAAGQDGFTAADLLRDREAVRRAYRAAAKLHHSDVGGNDALFAKVNEARDVLLNGAS